jgi:uncharacterized coiled-coil protein SlyX
LHSWSDGGSRTDRLQAIITDDMTDDMRSGEDSQLEQLEGRVTFNEGRIAGLSARKNDDSFYRMQKWGPSVILAVFLTMAGVIWKSIDKTIDDLHIQVAVLQTKNEEMSKQVAMLTQRIEDLVNTINRSEGLPIDRRKK